MKPIFHAIAGSTAMLIIACFWTSTLISELFMEHATVAAVKHAIVYGLFLLVPFLVATGGSGFALSKTHKGPLLDQKKKKRMPIIAANGLLVMIPAAIFLNSKAAADEFDAMFYSVQVVELIVGVVQLTLMGLNFRDGLRLAGKLAK